MSIFIKLVIIFFLTVEFIKPQLLFRYFVKQVFNVCWREDLIQVSSAFEMLEISELNLNSVCTL